MRYGPRFSNAGTSSKYVYDERIDKDMREVAKFFKGLSQQPLHKRELRAHNAKTTNKKTRAKHALGSEREDAEKLLAEAVRKCVALLEFHMDAMQQHARSPVRQRYCIPLKVHNVIYELRHKCGVAFADHDTHYTARQALDGPVQQSHEEILDSIRSEREQQRLARLRNLKEQAKRFAKFRKNTG